MAKKKAKKKTGASVHKDTKSHNVRISVISGTRSTIEAKVKLINQNIDKDTAFIAACEEKLKRKGISKHEKTVLTKAVKAAKRSLAMSRKGLRLWLPQLYTI